MPLIIFFAFFALILQLLHNDRGNGVFTKYLGEWVSNTYRFYFEPIYSLAPQTYIIIMPVIILIGTAMLLRKKV